MTKLKACPDVVKKMGALLVKARRSQEEAANDALAARKFLIDEVIPAMVKLGARELEAGAALNNLCDAARGHGLIGEAHNSLRSVIGRLGFAEPTDREIIALLNELEPISPQGGGGGGGRGRGGR